LTETPTGRRGRLRTRVALLLVVVAGGAFAIPASRALLLSTVGRALVAEDPLVNADVIVVGPDVGDAGVLEAADLVHRGIASRVSVLALPPTAVTREFGRRGILYADASTTQVALLRRLGVEQADLLSLSVNGTEETGARLAEWCAAQRIQSLVLITGPDHSRRFRRVMRRNMATTGTRVVLRVSRYSPFTAEHWWERRGTLRTGLIELQKLALDLVRHPAG
jgi:uncharacterized SAM-binding protein YcdF (DUF218 family)